MYPLNTYHQSTVDEQTFEADFAGGSTVFPHLTSNIAKDKYNTLRSTPYGNSLTMEMAKAAIDGESLGQNGNTDFLAISFSSTDYIGHAFGPNSVEIEDTYLRLDNDLAALFSYLDNKVGKGQYTVFLSADHGAAHVPAFLKEHKIPGGSMTDQAVATTLNGALEKQFKIKNAVLQVINYQIYLNRNIPTADVKNVEQEVIEQLLLMPAIENAFLLKELPNTPIIATLKTALTNGYNQKLSGDIQFVFKPNWFDGGSKGTTHGLWYPYNSHIPLVWYGWGIKKGHTNRETYMTDVSATLAALLHIQMPNGCIGKVITEITE